MSDTSSLSSNDGGSYAQVGFTGVSNGYNYVNGVRTTAVAAPQTTTTPTTTPTTPATPQPIPNLTDTAQIVPGAAQGANQINVVDAAGQLATNPSTFFDSSMTAADHVPTVSDAAIQAGSVPNTAAQGQTDAFNTPTALGSTTAATAPTATNAAPIETKTTASDVAATDMSGQHGTVSTQSQVDPSQILIDTAATAAGQTPTGAALNDYANLNISNVIDTSTASGKLLAQQLGEGNYVDSKATLEGQLTILQNEFKDPNTGEPVIPSWAAGTARSVSRIAAFTGMTGTAATAAMAQALLEASLPIAQQDSQFFQTVSLQNLSNQQQSIINKANVLSNFDLANMSAQMQAAVTNSQAFLQMDMQNLSNDQQAAVINTQDRVQSILQDANTENANRLFVATSQNQKDMFYDNLSASISQFNASQSNAMSQFNAGATNSHDEFNSQLENNRDQFYKNMQFQVDTANTKWRQSITMTKDQQAFEAASTDVKNKIGISTEMLNRIWDRSDALLDYAWKTADNEADRNNQINLMKLQNQQAIDQSNATGTGSLLGTLLGVGGSLILKAFGL